MCMLVYHGCCKAYHMNNVCVETMCADMSLCSIAWQNSTLLLTLQAVLAEVLAQVFAYKMGDATL